MNIFPTQYSVLSAKALIPFISAQYNINVLDCRLIIHNVSDTYYIETDCKKFIFKIYRDAHRKPDEIRGEAELLDYYRQNNVNVSYPIKDIDGNFLQSFTAAEGTRYGVVFSYAEGNPVYSLSDDQLRVIGIEMARLHICSSAVKLAYPRKKYTLETTLTEPLKIIEPCFKGMEDHYDIIQDIVTDVVSKMKNIDFSSFSYGYCQFDLLPKNFHFSEDGNLTFFDFDFAGEGYLINDIMSFYIHFFFEVFHKKMTRTEANRCFSVFVEAYRSIKPLSSEELNAIKYFGLGFWMFYFKFHVENFDDWSNIFFTPNFIKSRVGLIQHWMEY